MEKIRPIQTNAHAIINILSTRPVANPTTDSVINSPGLSDNNNLTRVGGDIAGRFKLSTCRAAIKLNAV
jgi:hypothetical protein